jgi:hypothetical protein
MTNAIDSEIIISDSGTTLVGPDATALLRARVICSSLRLHAKTGIIPTRGVSITTLKRLATMLTGHDYGRSKCETLRAAQDVEHWAATMYAALPITDNRKAKP